MCDDPLFGGCSGPLSPPAAAPAPSPLADLTPEVWAQLCVQASPVQYFCLSPDGCKLLFSSIISPTFLSAPTAGEGTQPGARTPSLLALLVPGYAEAEVLQAVHTHGTWSAKVRTEEHAWVEVVGNESEGEEGAGSPGSLFSTADIIPAPAPQQPLQGCEPRSPHPLQRKPTTVKEDEREGEDPTGSRHGRERSQHSGLQNIHDGSSSTRPSLGSTCLQEVSLADYCRAALGAGE